MQDILTNYIITKFDLIPEAFDYKEFKKGTTLIL